VQFLLAQAGLETGWGKSQPKAADGASSHNVFGVKAGRQYAGNVVAASTTEYVAGTPIRSTERFRSYGSYGDSFQDFVRLLKDNPRYAKVLASGGDANGYAQSLQRAGYATDPAYAAKLTRAIALVTRHTGAPAPTQVLAGNADTSSDRA
jgi:flagellar protein FlgJ